MGILEREEEHRRLLDEPSEAESLAKFKFLFHGERAMSHRKSPRPSLWMILCSATIATFLLLVGSGYNMCRNSRPAESSTPKQMAIPLHPEEHVLRAATTLEYHWNITLDSRSPDGVEKQVHLVNGAFPGPTIEARSGDRIIVHVHNGLASEGVSLHWHGLKMKGYNAMDGALGYTQCPIPAGKDFVYDFKIGDDESGTYWWHSHAEVQRGDGLYGGLVVHKPGSIPEHSQVLLLIGDWFHRKQTEVLDRYHSYASLGNEPVPDSLVINGYGRYDCILAVPARPVQCMEPNSTSTLPLLAKRPQAPVKFRMVNTGTISGLSFAADAATLQPVAVDGGFAVKGGKASSIGILYPGERVDVLANLDTGEKETSTLRIYIDEENFGGFPNPALNPNQTFAMFPAHNGDAGHALSPVSLLDKDYYDLSYLSAAVPTPTVSAPEAQQTILLYVKSKILARNGNRPTGRFNHTSWKMQSPPLLALNRSMWNSDQLVHFIGSGDEAPEIDIILNNLDDGSHPIPPARVLIQGSFIVSS